MKTYKDREIVLFILHDDYLFRISVPVPHITGTPTNFLGGSKYTDAEIVAQKWQQVVKLIFDLIPDRGEEVDITNKFAKIKGTNTVLIFPEVIYAILPSSSEACSQNEMSAGVRSDVNRERTGRGKLRTILRRLTNGKS